MSRARLLLKHCLVAHQAIHRRGTNPTSDLLGVDHFRSRPANASPTNSRCTIELFLRFYTENCPPRRLRVRVYRQATEGAVREVVYDRAGVVPFDPALRVFDYALTLKNVRAPGRGLYEVRVSRRCITAALGVRWKRLGADYFEVV